MRELSIGSVERDVSSDPTVTLGGNAVGNYKLDPFEMTEEILFGAINLLLQQIDDVTGLDLLPFAHFIEDQLGSGINLLTSFFNPISLFGTAAGIFFPLLSGGLFQGGLIPGLDASKIISGVFSLAQLPLQVLTSIGGVASSLINGILDLIHIPNLPASQVTSGTFFAGLIPALDASVIATGSFAQTLVSGLTGDLSLLTNTAQGILNGIVNGLGGLTGQLWGQSDADSALSAQAAATAAAAAAITQIQGISNQNNTGGLNAAVDFSDYPNSTNLPSVFTETYVGASAGSYGVASGLAKTTANASATDTRIVYGEYNVNDTITDYQRVCGIWTGRPGKDYNSYPFGPYYTHHYLYARWKDVNNWVRVDFSASDDATLQFCVAGVVTSPPTASVGHAFQPNTAYWLEAGSVADLYTFRVMAGGTPIITYTDASHVSQVGALFRGGSMGVTLHGSQGFGGAAKPGPMLYFALQDNSPAGIVGSGARVYRASASSVTQVSAEVPNAFFDTVDLLTDEYTFTSGNHCRITVSVTDWYVVSARLQGNGANSSVATLFHNGTLVRQAGSNSGGTGTAVCEPIYLTAGDTVSAGCSNNGGCVGNAAGNNSYLEITRVGRASATT